VAVVTLFAVQRQYLYRQQSDIRIRHPTQTKRSLRSSTGFTGFQKPIVPPTYQDPCHSYGMPLRPGTPIKAVLGGFYGEIAGYQKKQYLNELDKKDEQIRERVMNPPRNHTRASAMSSSFKHENNKKT